MKILEKIIKYGLYLAFLLPIVFTSQTMYPWHFGKILLFQILIEVLVVLALFYFGLSKKSIFKFSFLDWLVVTFIGVQLLAAIFGIDFNKSFWGNQQRATGVFTYIHFGLFYLLLRQFFREKKEWLNLGIFTIIISLISSFFAWFGNDLVFLKGIVSTDARISGIIGNPLFFAAYLIIPIFLSFGLSFYLSKENKWRYFLVTAGIVNSITLLIAQIRGALIGFVFALAVIWILYLVFGQSTKLKKILIICGIIFIAAGSGVYFFNKTSPYLKNNYPSVSRMLDISTSAETARTRLMSWQIALKGFKEKPIMGWGMENYNNVFDKYYNPEFLKYSMAETVWDKPHNYYLEILVSAGIIGFLTYAALICALFYSQYKTLKISGSRERMGLIFIIGAAIAYLGQNTFGIETGNSLELWFFIIALVGFFYADTMGKKEIYSSGFIYKIVSWAALALIFIFPFLIIKNISFYKASVLMGNTRDYAEIQSLYNWRQNAEKTIDYKVPFSWEQAIFLTQDLSKFDGKQILNKETLEPVAYKMADIYEAQIKKDPTSYQERFWAGQLYGFMGEYLDKKYFTRSEELLKEAIVISPESQNAPLMLAKNYMIAGENKNGIEVLQKLIEQDPSYLEPHWFLGLAYMQDGQIEKGMEELEKGKSFGINFNKGNALYLLDLYAGRKEFAKMIPLYNQLIASEPDNPQYFASLAAVYAEMGDKENTVEALSKAVELQPELANEAKVFLKEKGFDK